MTDEFMARTLGIGESFETFSLRQHDGHVAVTWERIKDTQIYQRASGTWMLVYVENGVRRYCPIFDGPVHQALEALIAA